MATFYNQEDQDIYAGGDHFIPQQYYRLNKFNNTVAPVPPEIIPPTTQNFGIPYTGAFTGGDGYQGGGKWGNLDLSNTKMFDKNVFSVDMAAPGAPQTESWQNKQVRGFYDPQTGQYKTWEGKNINHLGMDIPTIAGAIFDKDLGKGPQIGDIEGTFTHGWDSGKGKIKEGWEDEKDKWSGILGIDKAKAFFKGKKDQENFINTAVDTEENQPGDGDTTTTITTTDQNQTGDGPGSWGGHGSVEAYDKSQEETYARAKDRLATGGRVGFFEGALADTKEGKAMSPGTSAQGGTHEGGYGRDDVPLGDTPVIPPQDNFTVDTDLLSTSPNVEFNYSPNNLAHLRALIYNKDIVSEDDINLEGSVSGGIGPVDWSSYFDQEGITGSNVGIGPVNTYISPNKNIDLNYTGNIGGWDVNAGTNLQDNASVTASKNGWDIGLTHGPTGTDATLNKTWAWGPEPEQPVNALSYDDLIYGQNLRYGGLVGIL